MSINGHWHGTETDRDTAIGAIVLLVGLVILGWAYGASGRAGVPGYDLIARFNRAEGITVGSEVRLSGLVVGKVVGQGLGPHFRAVLHLKVSPDIKVPVDSAALIHTDGLLGAKYIAIQVGGDENNLRPGDEIRYTQDSVNVRDLLALIVAEGRARRGYGQQP